MPVLTDEAMDAVVLEPPWEMSGDDMLGKMICELNRLFVMSRE
jgi:hypothetical protein